MCGRGFEFDTAVKDTQKELSVMLKKSDLKKVFAFAIICIPFITTICYGCGRNNGESKIVNFTTEQPMEISTEFPLLYTVEYTEYKEEQWDKFKIYVPYVKNLGNQDLEKTINSVLKKEAVTWLMNDNIFSKGHQSKKPLVKCQSNQILSIELPYRSVGGRRLTFVSQFITIDMQTGRKITYKELIKNEGKLIDLLRDGKSVSSDGTICDYNQKESDDYIKKRMKKMSEDDIKDLLNQCSLSQESISLYDEGLGKPTVETRTDFYVTEDAFTITYTEGIYHYDVSIGLEKLEKEGVINKVYF